jgi:hypothetical protein
MKLTTIVASYADEGKPPAVWHGVESAYLDQWVEKAVRDGVRTFTVLI